MLLLGITAVLFRLFLAPQTDAPTATPSSPERTPQISTVIVTETAPPTLSPTAIIEEESISSSAADAEPPPTDTPTATPTAVPPLQAGSTSQRDQDNQPLLFVPAGTMQMGTANDTPGIVPTPHERPAHEVALDAFLD
ncbi:MAG: hypothetical protein M5U34_47415 [Chloroflexi bacterium]|nr:hypothetical protein [Chloroflexota bacterium]